MLCVRVIIIIHWHIIIGHRANDSTITALTLYIVLCVGIYQRHLHPCMRKLEVLYIAVSNYISSHDDDTDITQKQGIMMYTSLYKVHVVYVQ